MKEYTYTVILGPSWKGAGFRASCPLLPGLSANADTREEAVRKIRPALDRRLDRMIARGERIPSEPKRKRQSN